MINQATNYLPVQQAAVQQQMQQGQMPMVQNLQAQPPKGPEFNAIKIDIIKPEVKAAQDPVYSMPYTPIYSYPEQTQAPVSIPPSQTEPVVLEQQAVN